MTSSHFSHRESGVATTGADSALVSELGVGRLRWKYILDDGWVGQQSFISLTEIEDSCQIRAGDVLLDLGCGDGMFVQTIAVRSQSRAYGLDPNASFNLIDGIAADLFEDDIETGLTNPSVQILDVDVLISCDALQYVEEPLQHLGAYLDHFQPRSVFCSLWLCEDDDVRANWGFAAPTCLDELTSFCGDRGLTAQDGAHFRRRIHRQLESLETHEASLRQLWGDEGFERRRHLEGTAAAAADDNLLRQAWITGGRA